jgi:hypothetical protein
MAIPLGGLFSPFRLETSTGRGGHRRANSAQTSRLTMCNCCPSRGNGPRPAAAGLSHLPLLTGFITRGQGVATPCLCVTEGPEGKPTRLAVYSMYLAFDGCRALMVARRPSQPRMRRRHYDENEDISDKLYCRGHAGDDPISRVGAGRSCQRSDASDAPLEPALGRAGSLHVSTGTVRPEPRRHNHAG